MNGDNQRGNLICPRCGSDIVKRATPYWLGWWMGNYFASLRTVCVNCNYEFGAEGEILWDKGEMEEEEFEKARKKIIKEEAGVKERKEFTNVWFCRIVIAIIALRFTLRFILPILRLIGSFYLRALG